MLDKAMGFPRFNVCITLLLVPFLNSFHSQTGTEASATYANHICPNTATFTINSTFQFNFNRLLSSLVSNAINSTGFYNTTTAARNSVDTVYGLFLCRGDPSSNECQDCVDAAVKDVVDRCPNEKETAAWYDGCMVRYSNQYIFSSMVTDPIAVVMNAVSISEAERFDQVLRTTMNDLASGIYNTGTRAKKFGTKEAN